MNSRNFDDLKSLIGILTQGEIATAKKFLVAFDSNVTRGKNKNQALLKEIINRPHISLEKAKKKISPDVDERSFDRQVLRLKEKLLESLLIDINTSKKEVFGEWFGIQIDVRKKYLQANTLYARGLTSEAMRLYDKVEEKAKEFELFSELFEVFNKKKATLGIRQGPSAFDEYEKKSILAKECYDANLLGETHYHRHFINDVDPKGLKSEKIGYLTQAIAELQVAYKKTNASLSGYYMHFLLMEYYLIQEDFKASIETGETLLHLIESRPAINSKPRLGFVNDDIAQNQLFTFNFEESLIRARKAQDYYSFNGYNFQMARETEFRALYYQGKLDDASAVVDELIDVSKDLDAPFQYDKRRYLKACVLYMQGQYRDSFLLLQDVIEVRDDKEGWNIGLRLLSIMNMIEMRLFDNADAQIEAMRKHVGRNTDVIRPRDEIILKLLMHLERASFNFEKVFNEQRDLLRQISQNEPDYRWEVKTPEMVVFQDWFTAKMEGSTYTFKLPESALVALENPKKAKPILPETLVNAKTVETEKV